MRRGAVYVMSNKRRQDTLSRGREAAVDLGIRSLFYITPAWANQMRDGVARGSKRESCHARHIERSVGDFARIARTTVDAGIAVDVMGGRHLRLFDIRKQQRCMAQLSVQSLLFKCNLLI
jgi:hypothetical protein